MKVLEAIERADALRPNPFSAEEKLRWLSELDGKIAGEILDINSEFDYINANEETELLVKLPYTDIYLFYLCAMIDFFSRDYGEYNNSMLMVNSIMEALAKAVIRGDVIYDDKTADSDSTGSGEENENDGETSENGDGGNCINIKDKSGTKSSDYYKNIF